MNPTVIGMPLKNIDPYTIGSGEAIRQTDKALLVEILDGPLEDEKIWVPLSVICPQSDVTDEGDRGLLIVFKWWAHSEGYDEV